LRAIVGCVAAALVCTGLTTGTWAADVSPEGAAAGDQVNYSLGYAFGEHLASLRRQGITAEPEAIFRGVLDALAGAQPSLDRTEMRKALDALQVTAAAGERREKTEPEQAMPPGRKGGFVDDFARLNAERPGVVTLPSGVQYEVLKQGAGRTPGPNDQVTVGYEATLSNGIVFDSTTKEDGPFQMRIGDIMVPGLKEALLLMQEGDKWRVVIPPRMGFGRAGNNMLRKRDLIYEIELVAVKPSGTGAMLEGQPAETGKEAVEADQPQRAAPE